jgi:DNA polymerase-3 subunit delta
MKNIKQYTAILKSLNERHYDSVYVLDGNEPFFIDIIAKRLEKEVLPESQQSFNLHTFYGRDIKVQDLVAACRRYPMMADHQLIVLREAQFMKNIEDLIDYVGQPTQSTILVVLYKGKRIAKNTKLGIALKKHTHLTTDKLWDYEVLPWLKAHLKTMGLQMDTEAMNLMVETYGTNLDIIDGELAKIIANVGDGVRITVTDFEKSSGINRDFTIFALTSAMSKRNLIKSLEIGSVLAKDKKNTPIQMMVPMLYNFFKKVILVWQFGEQNHTLLCQKLQVSNYKLREYIDASKRYTPVEVLSALSVLSEIDHRAKGIGESKSDETELLRELVVRIIN